jgi:prevent-host-death family protein
MRGVRVVPISKARPQLTTLVEEAAQTQEPAFIASRSRVRAVLLGTEAYNVLLERLEDAEDGLDILQARASGEPSRPLADALNELTGNQERDVRRRA